MKALNLGLLLGVSIALVAWSADTPESPWTGPTYEYASVRWAGDRTSIIWPDGSTQKVIAFSGRKRADGIDERVWYLTGAMNVMGRRGFELVHMNNDEVVMKRVAAGRKE